MAPPHTPGKRKQAILLADLGWSQRKIADKVKMPQSSVNHTLRRWREHGTHHSLPTPGRPNKLDARAIRLLVKQFILHPDQKWDDFAREFGVCVKTIREIAKKHDFHKRIKRTKPFISQKARKERVEWTKQNKDRDWTRGIIWTDESSIEMGKRPGKEQTIRRPGKEFNPKHIQTTFHSGRQTLMVWGCITYGYKYPLLRLPIRQGGKNRERIGLNGERYTQWVLEAEIHPIVEDLKDMYEGEGVDVLVVEDGAPAHCAQHTKNARATLGIKNLTHPPSSPDLNPIETMWLIVKTKVAAMERQATTLEEQWGQVQVAWDAISIETVNALIDTIAERRDALAKAKGMQIGF